MLEDVEEVLRLTRLLLRDSGSQLAAAANGWKRPFSTEAFLLSGVYQAWAGEPHPLMPEVSKSISEVDERLADMALEAMNRR